MLDTITEFTPVEDFSNLDTKLQQLLNYWRGKGSEGVLPSRKDIDPIEIPRLMPHVAMIDILRDPLDYRYRLSGTHLVEMIGHDRTGRRMREFFTAPAIEAAEQMLERLLSRRKPLAFEGRLYWIERDYLAFHALILPLAADGHTVDMAIMGVHFGPADVSR